MAQDSRSHLGNMNVVEGVAALEDESLFVNRVPLVRPSVNLSESSLENASLFANKIPVMSPLENFSESP